MMIQFGSKGKYIMDRHVDEVLMGLGKEVWFTFWWLTRNVVWKKEGVKHKEYGVHMPRGSYLVSRRELADAVDVTEGKMRTILKKLVEIGLIDIQTVEVKTKFGKKKLNHVTIVDYDLYQSIGQEESKEEPNVTQGVTQAAQGQDEKHTQGKHSNDAGFSDSNTQDEYRSDITFTQALPEHDPSFTQAHVSNHAASDHVVTQALPEVYPNYDPKRTNSIKNEGIKNEEYNQPSNKDSLSLEDWKTDEDYLYCKEQCGWLVGSDSKIHQYFVSARKEMKSNQEIIDAWNAYKEKEPLKDQNLATFLSYKFRDYLHTESSSPVIPFGKYAHLVKRSRIPRR